MYKRLIILAVILLGAVGALAVLGYRAIEMQAQGMRGQRLGEFAAVAEQVRRDVKRKLDAFLETEQNRPYAEYLYYYVPGQTASQALLPVQRSALGQKLGQGLAWGYFQVEPDGRLVNPYFNDNRFGSVQGAGGGGLENQDPNATEAAVLQKYLRTVRTELLPRLNIREQNNSGLGATLANVQKNSGENFQGKGDNRLNYQMNIQSNQASRSFRQQRSVAELNLDNAGQTQSLSPSEAKPQAASSIMPPQAAGPSQRIMPGAPAQAANHQQREEVQILMEPFVPVRAGRAEQGSILGGSVYLLRHVRIETRHLLQGFRLNEAKLLEEIRDSAGRALRGGMDFSLERGEAAGAAFTAVLNFDFGQVVLNLRELDPRGLGRQIGQMRQWYFGVIGVAGLVLALALGGVWRNMQAQLRLARKKDEFISAVSHELRTPLTSIRMYTEMLEKDWVRTEEKRREYYGGMRLESERLSRLIENVLDFSRITRGKKNYHFQLGDLNACVGRVLEMLGPYIGQAGFRLEQRLGELPPLAFDPDAVSQIIINLVDNAVKYAGTGEKRVILRTEARPGFVVIEVEDRGPGVPHRQREKVFDPFYRCAEEAGRVTTGVGLGLALVRQFAQAHQGFVEVDSAEPAGALFRVGLAT